MPLLGDGVRNDAVDVYAHQRQTDSGKNRKENRAEARLAVSGEFKKLVYSQGFLGDDRPVQTQNLTLDRHTSE